VGVAFLAFLELGSTDSSSIGPYLGTCSGETLLLKTVLLEGILWIGGVYLVLGAAGAVPLPLAGV